MSYAVVIFDKDDSVAVVSKEWLKISKSKTACYWPDIRNPKKMERAIINHEQPEDDWVSYTVKVKYETGILEEVHMMFCQNTVFNFVIYFGFGRFITLLINISPLFDHILDDIRSLFDEIAYIWAFNPN